MNYSRPKILKIAASCVGLFLGLLPAQDAVSPEVFKSPPKEAKVHTWWHWISGNINKEGITKDLESMHRQGITQATILNVGGFVSAKLDIPNVKFASPEWYEMFRFSLEEAERLGMTIGLHNCDGWSTSGGPWVTPEQSMKEFTWTKTEVQGGGAVKVQLPEPPKREGYYEEVVVLAYPSTAKPELSEKAVPQVRVGKNEVGTALHDGNPFTSAEFSNRKPITVSFEKAREVEQISLLSHLIFIWGPVNREPIDFMVSSSMNGKDFEKLTEIKITGANIPHRIDIPKTKARHFRIEASKSRYPFTIAELEFLKRGEPSYYSNRIEGLLQKTVAIKVSNEKLYEPSQVDDDPVVQANQVLDISSAMDAKTGELEWDAPEGDWTVLRFGFTSTGMKNKPATPEGEGLEIDKMDAEAAKAHFEGFTQKLIDVAGPMTGETFIFTLIDSWECKFQNWTQKFPEHFSDRRGYDLKNWIPVLAGEVIDDFESSEAFLHDFRETIADLIGENYYKAWADLCSEQDLAMHAEAIYGGGAYPPLDILKANSYADLPMLEFWARPDKETLISNYKPRATPDETFPSLSALAYDMPVVGSEAYTNRCYYSEAPGDLKPYGDAAFCAGVNQMIMHSYVHQPIEEQPGVTLGIFGGPYNRNNPWWKDTSSWMTYQARVQYLLQEGEPVVDCLTFVGDQLPQSRRDILPRGIPKGFRSGICNFELLKERITVVDGKLSLGGLQRFEFLVLPERTSMEYATLARLEELLDEGATVVGPKPTRLLGLKDFGEKQEAFVKLTDRIWGTQGGQVDRKVGKGRLLAGHSLAEVFELLKLQPNFEASSASERELMFRHKKTDAEEIYFVFNQTKETIHTDLIFRVSGMKPEIWQAETGEVISPAVYLTQEGRTRLPVSFKPGESFFFIFRKGEKEDHITQIKRGAEVVFPSEARREEAIPQVAFADGALVYSSKVSGEYSFQSSGGEERTKSFRKARVVDLGAQGAQLSFKPIYKEEVPPIQLDQLISLTELEDPRHQYFAGAVTYQITFEVSQEILDDPAEVLIDFGKLDATAQVSLNGQTLGELWVNNTELPVREWLKKSNTLTVEVATVCRNRALGDLRLYDKIQSIFTTAPLKEKNLLDASLPLKPSGLMGPVRLIQR